MKVKTKTQLKQALAKILNKCRQLIDITDSKAAKETLEEFSQISAEALDNPSMATVDFYILGVEHPAKRRKRKPKKEPQPCTSHQSTSPSEPSPSGTS